MLIWTNTISPSAYIIQKPQVKSAPAIHPDEQQCSFFSEGLQKILNFKKCTLRFHLLFYSFWHFITERQSNFQNTRNVLLSVVTATVRKTMQVRQMCSACYKWQQRFALPTAKPMNIYYSTANIQGTEMTKKTSKT